MTAPDHPVSGRRHDVDWIRTGALGLLIVYHTALSFQPFASDIGFPANDEPLDGLWRAMSLLNVWRIPILFVISGMGVWFAMRRRSWKGLLADRSMRLLLPLVFFRGVAEPMLGAGTDAIGWDAAYGLHFGHLWFLGNIFAYALLLVGPLYWLERNPGNRVNAVVRRVLTLPGGVLLGGAFLVAEAAVLDPDIFVLYAMTPHGFALGLVCFALGAILVGQGEHFFEAVARSRWLAVFVAAPLFALRSDLGWGWEVPTLTALECWCWMMAVVGFAARHLNQPSRALGYLSKAVYPVYIAHLPIQFALSYGVLHQPWSAAAKLLVIVAGTLALSMLTYELVKPVPYLRALFGIVTPRGKTA